MKGKFLMFKYVGSSQIMDKRKLENRSRMIISEDDDRFREMLQQNPLFERIIAAIPANTPNFLDLLRREADKRLQVHSLRCKKCKEKETKPRVNCKTAEILINIEEGL